MYASPEGACGLLAVGGPGMSHQLRWGVASDLDRLHEGPELPLFAESSEVRVSAFKVRASIGDGSAW